MKASGILIPVNALPGDYGIGDLGPCAYRFIDFCKQSGQRYWQILPINPTDGINGHSPYSSPSAFAGNPLLISLALLVDEGLLTRQDLTKAKIPSQKTVDYPRVIAIKDKFLSKACGNFFKKPLPDSYTNFIAHNTWLNDYALFVTIKAAYQGASWDTWPTALRTRQPKALKLFESQHVDSLNKVKFIQYVFYKQWVQLKAYANAQGVSIIGDIPIYVNFDSADVWCAPQFFQVDKKGHLTFVSGCPPDYFSKTGQRWGNPTYHWANLKKDKYRWWINRFRHNLALFDCLRVDHFRGFVGFWQIPAHEKLAVFGRWVKAPGEHFFGVLKKEFKQLPIIAEDLGEITPDVIKLMKKFQFPGMRVMLFAFGGDPKTNPHVPANYPQHCVAYTGTHDNNTVQGWLATEAKEYERLNITKVLGGRWRSENLHGDMIDVLLKSKAQLTIIPMQDILGLGQEARLNTPATKVNNWSWRLLESQMTTKLSTSLMRVTTKAGRYGHS